MLSSKLNNVCTLINKVTCSVEAPEQLLCSLISEWRLPCDVLLYLMCVCCQYAGVTCSVPPQGGTARSVAIMLYCVAVASSLNWIHNDSMSDSPNTDSP